MNDRSQQRRNPLGVNPSEHDAEGTEATIIKVLEVEAEAHNQAAEDAELEAENPTPSNDGKSSEELANWHRHRARFLESLASELHGDADDAYRWRMELLGKLYEPKAIALLEQIKEVVQGAGFFTGSPVDMGGEELMWSLAVYRTEEAINDDSLAERDAIDITVKLCEQRQYEGGEGFGVNFSVDIVEFGGRILGGLSPYNYTPDVWVDGKDEQAVKDRWQLLADADIHGIPDLLRKGNQ